MLSVLSRVGLVACCALAWARWARRRERAALRLALGLSLLVAARAAQGAIRALAAALAGPVPYHGATVAWWALDTACSLAWPAVAVGLVARNAEAPDRSEAPASRLVKARNEHHSRMMFLRSPAVKPALTWAAVSLALFTAYPAVRGRVVLAVEGGAWALVAVVILVSATRRRPRREEVPALVFAAGECCGGLVFAADNVVRAWWVVPWINAVTYTLLGGALCLVMSRTRFRPTS